MNTMKTIKGGDTRLGGGGGQPADAYPVKVPATKSKDVVKGGSTYKGKSPGMRGMKGLGVSGTKSRVSKTGY